MVSRPPWDEGKLRILELGVLNEGGKGLKDIRVNFGAFDLGDYQAAAYP